MRLGAWGETREFKMNWGGAGDTGWLLARRRNLVDVEIEVNGKVLVKGYLTAAGEVMCDSEDCWAAAEMWEREGILNTEGHRIFLAAENLFRTETSTYFYSPS